MTSQSRKTVASLATILVLVLAVGVYDQVVRPKNGVMMAGLPRNLDEMNRSIANANPLRDREEIEWEHSVAEKLKEAKGILERGPANFGRAPSEVEELRFGILRGKYRIQFSEGAKIQEIAFIESIDSGEQPVMLEGQEFLTKFQSDFAVTFNSYKLKEKSENNETYELLDPANGLAGLAIFDRDDKGRLLKFRVSSNLVQ